MNQTHENEEKPKGKDIKVLCILAVDDEPLNNRLLEKGFRSQKQYELITTQDPKQALDLLKQKKIDVILSDYRMPDMNGVDLLKEAKKLCADPICIMVTAYPDLKEVMEAQANGLVNYIVTKPYSLDDLVKKIERSITAREMRQLAQSLSKQDKSRSRKKEK